MVDFVWILPAAPPPPSMSHCDDRGTGFGITSLYRLGDKQLLDVPKAIPPVGSIHSAL